LTGFCRRHYTSPDTVIACQGKASVKIGGDGLENRHCECDMDFCCLTKIKRYIRAEQPETT
jgi:hypothetical protein